MGLSFALKLFLILKYKNLLSLDSDDLNYIKSAVFLIKRGVITYHDYNEPTVFIMPLYPLFLGAMFRLLGWGLTGFQAVRIVQALLSSVTDILVYLMGRRLFDQRTALLSSFLMCFYWPNIVTPAYFLTETLFTFLLCLLVYFSLKFAEDPRPTKFIFLGVLTAAATGCRPTIALYPALLAIYMFFIYRRSGLWYAAKCLLVMTASLVLVLSPWWVRNYVEYGEFIPLTASSGNPLLQGTYVNYRQTPETQVQYGLAKNALERDRIEREAALKRIAKGFREDFRAYLKWYTIGKTVSFWGSPFYWKTFLGVDRHLVYPAHFVLLLGFGGAALLMFRKRLLKPLLPFLVIVCFNIVHCVYMAFDRYAYPLLPLLSLFSAFFLLQLWDRAKKYIPRA